MVVSYQMLVSLIVFLLISGCDYKWQYTSTKEEDSSTAPRVTVDETLARYAEKKEIWLNEKTSKLNILAPFQHYQFLKGLEWLIGEWVADSQYGKVYSKYSWGKNKNYIIFDLVIHTTDGLKIEGIELISYDESKKVICSWFLSSLGELSPEEYWRHEGNSWIVEEPFIKAGSLRSIYSNITPTTFTWEQKAYTEDGTLSQRVDPVVNIRER